MKKSSAFTLIELLVVISIIALLIAILLPVLASSRRATRATACLSNQRQVGISMAAHAVDNKDTFPAPVNFSAFFANDFYTWGGTLYYKTKFLKSSEYLFCPSSGVPSGAERAWDPDIAAPSGVFEWSPRWTYGMRGENFNAALPIRLGNLRAASEYWVTADSASSNAPSRVGDGVDGWNGFYILDSSQHLQLIHDRASNIAHADGSVRAYLREELLEVIAEEPEIRFDNPPLIYPDGTLDG